MTPGASVPVRGGVAASKTGAGEANRCFGTRRLQEMHQTLPHVPRDLAHVTRGEKDVS